MSAGVTNVQPTTRQTDAKGRVILPKGFGNTLVAIDQVDEFEVRIRKMVAIPQREAWLQGNPAAAAAVKAGLEQAAAGELVDTPDFAADSAEFDDEG